MIRDIADIIVGEYGDPALRQNAQVVHDYLHNIQGFGVDENNALVNRINPNDGTILHLIAVEPDLGRALLVLDSLIAIMEEYGIDQNQSTDLCWAIKTGNLAQATKLLANGANPNGPIDKNGKIPAEIVFRIQRECCSREHLYADTKSQYDQIIGKILKGSDANIHTYYDNRYYLLQPLHLAYKRARRGDDAFEKLLYTYGAYTNIEIAEEF